MASFEPRSSVASLPMVLASPGERRSPELAAHSAANVRVRREYLALPVRQDSISYPAETDRLAGAYLNAAVYSPGSVMYSASSRASTRQRW